MRIIQSVIQNKERSFTSRYDVQAIYNKSHPSKLYAINTQLQAR